jgi:hypothetical protein
VKKLRAELVAAGLTMLSAYCAAGRPRMNLSAWGSFDDWSGLVREAVVWCGNPDPGKTREELAKRSDVVAGALTVIINQWTTIDPNLDGLKCSEIIRILEKKSSEHESIREAICDFCSTFGDKLPSPGSLGNRLKRVRGRVIDGKLVDSDDSHGTAKWVVRPIKNREPSCSGGSGCSVAAEDDVPIDNAIEHENDVSSDNHDDFDPWEDTA